MAHYLISEAAHLVDVEPHVLRYWEDELDISIPRNELGHRYYTEQHIEMFKKVKVFKERGYQLKAIRANYEGQENLENACEIIPENASEASESKLAAVNQETEKDFRMQEFKTIMTDIVADAMAANSERMTGNLSKEVSERIIKEINYLAREQENREDERFKHFDEVLRGYQRGHKARAEAALTKEKTREGRRESRREKRPRGRKRKAEAIEISAID